jgi:hypothetical protein
MRVRSCVMRRKASMGQCLSGGRLCLILLLLSSCAIGPESYLKSAVNHASQDVVTKSFGPPHLTRVLSTGEEVWLYSFTSPNAISGCTAYVLTFDRERILRNWQWQPSCPHTLSP